VRYVLCLRNPWSSHVERSRLYDTKLDPTAPHAHPMPIGIQLASGLRCFVRVGGAWGQPKGHPELYGTYFCQWPGSSQWGPDLWGKHDESGIDRSHKAWTVLVADEGGGVTRQAVAKAFFVATA
jgi:hypothetical protein